MLSIDEQTMIDAKKEFIEYPEYKDLFEKLPNQVQRICNDHRGIVSGSAVRFLIEKHEKMDELHWKPEDIDIYINKRFFIANLMPDHLKKHGIVDVIAAYYNFTDEKSAESTFRPDHSRIRIKNHPTHNYKESYIIYEWPVYYTRKTTRCEFEDSLSVRYGTPGFSRYWDEKTKIQVILHDDVSPVENFDCVGNMMFIEKNKCMGHPDAKKLIKNGAMGWVIRPMSLDGLCKRIPRMEKYSHRMLMTNHHWCKYDLQDVGRIIKFMEALDTSAVENPIEKDELEKRMKINIQTVINVWQIYCWHTWNVYRMCSGCGIESAYTI